jgi:hypothetical protein
LAVGCERTECPAGSRDANAGGVHEFRANGSVSRRYEKVQWLVGHRSAARIDDRHLQWLSELLPNRADLILAADDNYGGGRAELRSVGIAAVTGEEGTREH